MTDISQTDTATPPKRPMWRRIVRALLAIPTALIILAMLTLLGAQVIRDRSIVLALLMYIPLWPVAIAAVVWDLLLLGRALPLRFLLLCLGLALSLLSIGMMWSPPRPPEGDSSATTIRILQWNTQWGGGGQAALDQITNEIARRGADIVLLSEAPWVGWIQSTWARNIGNGWHFSSVENRKPQSYWYRMMVVSRFDVRLIQEWLLTFGVAALFEVNTGPRPLRILMVDLESYEWHPRTPAIAQAAAIADDLAARGQPIDIIAGDFNTPARFIGFDVLTAAGEGFDRAAFWSGQWRATWPAFLQYRGRRVRGTWRLSALDIDHIFVRRNIDVASAQIFCNDATDHRGQTVDLRMK